MTALIRTAVIFLLAIAATADAQWDPFNGQFGKTEPTDIRVMTWNVGDGINSQAEKTDEFNSWNALVRIVAAMRPDVLVIQEAADRPSGGADSVSALETTLDLFVNGGPDPFEGGQVTSYVRRFTDDLEPGYDLPHVYVSTLTDGFNRNVVVSRYPFVDLNGDGKAALPDMPFTAGDEWAPGGTGGIRGVPFVEIDLPDDVYAGDLVAACAHLKSGGGSDDIDDRQVASRNLSYFIHFFFNGAGTGEPDPNGTIFANPDPTDILGPNTPVILGGDLNEDEQRNGRRGPAEWLATGGGNGGTDGTDRDLTDAMSDDAADPFNGDDDTQGSSKLDYIIWQDSIAQLRRAFVFNSSTANAQGELPQPVDSYPTLPLLASAQASDHLPVIADFQLPLGGSGDPPGAFALVAPDDDAEGVQRETVFQWAPADGADTYTLTVREGSPTGPVAFEQQNIDGTSLTAPELGCATTHSWTVVAVNDAGETEADNAPFSFVTAADADLTGPGGDGVPDGSLTADDFFFYLGLFAAGDAGADLTGPGGDGVPDGSLTADDFFFYLGLFAAGGCA